MLTTERASHDDSTATLGTDRIILRLSIDDPDVLADLRKHPAGAERDEFAKAALRVGVLALRQASGVVDAEVVRRQAEQLVTDVSSLVTRNSTDLVQGVRTALAQYFDPSSGNLVQRLDRLVNRDGELDALLARHLGEGSSTLSRTLEEYLGKGSTLMQTLAPGNGNGLPSHLREIVESASHQQRDRLLREFSLDEPESALARLVREISSKNGRLRSDLRSDLETVRREFSLDNEGGALARLVGRVEATQQSLHREFSLDEEGSAMSRLMVLLQETQGAVQANLTLDDASSPLSRLRQELLSLLGDVKAANDEFHIEVRSTLDRLQARRKEAARSTRHGEEFESALGEVLQTDCQGHEDVLETCGQTTGRVPHSKKGDFVIVLGEESAAAGARLVVEAKEDQRFTAAKALAELDDARRNRDARVGVFVFSRRTAPEDLEVLSRRGRDVLVVWDQDDPASDAFLRVALSLARALSTKQAEQNGRLAADMEAIDDAVLRIGKRAADLEQVATWARTVESSGSKIRGKVDTVRGDLERQLKRLGEHLDGVRARSGGE